jgi:protein associated with RNAse G/E
MPDEPPEERPVLIRATNYDGSPHWEHDALLVQHADGLVITRTQPGLTVSRGDGGSYVSPFVTRAHYWTERWFNVIRLELPGKGLDGFYCNVASPVSFDGRHVRYVDLQLDVRVYALEGGGLRYDVLDEDEFQAARRRFAYPDDVIARCRGAVDELIALIEARQFPE